MNDTLNLLERDTNTTTSETTSSGNNDNTWSRGDIMALVFGLFTVLALVIAWFTYYEPKKKEWKRLKNRREEEKRRRAEVVIRRACER